MSAVFLQNPARLRRRLRKVLYFSCSWKWRELSLFAVVLLCVVFLSRSSLTDNNHRAKDRRWKRVIFDDSGQPGSMGAPVKIDTKSLTSAEYDAYEAGFKVHQFNQYASDMISLHRSLPDFRTEECLSASQNYGQNLPDTSIVICFHNEAWSTLLRSVHSILDRTPPHLLTEIILVDDASDLEHLKDPLEQYLKTLPKVTLVRSEERIGLIKARLLGYKHVSGTALIFLDSHIECTEGWIEPLLDRIAEKETNVAFPVIDVISLKNFGFKNDQVYGNNVGGFDWDMQFSWHRIPERDNIRRKSKSAPVRSPTMPGGLFAINRKFFEKLGTYDEDFDIWGGENLELSFKIWMCGGLLEMVPCSRVGHVFRTKSPYKWRDGQDVLKRNLIRVAEVWLDDYKKYHYERLNGDLGDFGDVASRVALRKNLQCKSFGWYVENVYPDMYIPDRALAWGEVRNEAYSGRYCLDAGTDDGSNKTLDVYSCHGLGSNQYWSYTFKKELRRDNYCADHVKDKIRFAKCHDHGGNQNWEHDAETRVIRHHITEYCLELDKTSMSTVFANCDETKPEQRWRFENYAPTGQSGDSANNVHLDRKVNSLIAPPAAGDSDDRKVIQQPAHVDVDKTDARKHIGPGEMGEAVKIDRDALADEEKKLLDLGFEKNSFNQYASDMISVKRSLPDMRPESCKNQKYSDHLPDTSVIVCFHNEAWSTLLRTVHSILDRTPPQLLTEILLVDDASDQDHLKGRLEKYFAKYPKVKIIRSPDRVGLIKARLLGYDVAVGTTLTFLDSHIECTEGWLEPMVDRIAKDSTKVVWPVIDIINDRTFEYKNDADAGSQVGGFDWGLQFNWHIIPERDRKDKNRKFKTDPVRSPTMAGGLFSIDRKFFTKLGTYDPDFDIWGGENLEISFKTWMCGGTLEMIPCSRVGHVFRDKSPYKWRTGKDVLKKNLVRLAKVWMDDYANYYFERINDELGDYGDISDRLAIRKNLNCKSFSWYIDNVYPELYIPSKSQAWGEVRNRALAGAYCMDADPDSADGNKTVDVYTCHGQGGNQHWSLSNDSEIRRDDSCVDFAHTRLKILPCHGAKGNQEWIHDRKSGLIRNPGTDTCMQISENLKSITMTDCDAEKLEQAWDFKNYAGDPPVKTLHKKKPKRRRA